MQLMRWRFASDWNTGTYGGGGSVLDQSGNVSVFGHPTVAPTASHGTLTTSTGTQILAGTSTPVCTLSAGNVWLPYDVLGATAQAGDYFQFTTTSAYVLLTFVGTLASGQGLHVGGTNLAANAVRNGALAQVYVGPDTTHLSLVANVDCYLSAPQLALNLVGGATHVIRVQHSGNYNTKVAPIGTPVAVTGTTVSSSLVLTQSGNQKTLLAASWRVLATASGLFSLYRTLPGGAETLISAGLTTGTVYNNATYVPGVSLYVNAPITGLITNDVATFTTDKTMIGIQTIQVAASGSSAITTSYTSYVMDSVADPYQDAGPDTQWFLLEWLQNDWFQGQTDGINGYTAASLTLKTGNTPAVDGTWKSYTTTPKQTYLRDSATYIGQAGLQASNRGRYCQWTLQFPSGLSGPMTPWMGDAGLYCWVPERDSHFVRKIAFGRGWQAGPIMQDFLGTISCDQADSYMAMLDLIQNFAINTSTDQAAINYAADLNDVRLGTESTPNLADRLSLMTTLRPQGGTVGTIASLMAMAAGGAFPVTTLSVNNATGYLTATSASTALTTGNVVVAQIASPDLTVTIPPPTTGGYPNMPGTPLAIAQTLLTAYLHRILPLTATVNLTFS